MSSEEAAFLAVLKANPADDIARLVYADWLDDRCDPRSRYVRLVCALASMSETELCDSAAAYELLTESKRFSLGWQATAGARFEMALLEFRPTDQYNLVHALAQVLTPTPRVELEARIRAVPTALRTPMTFADAVNLHGEWQRYRSWFSAKPYVVVRAIPTLAYSECGLFDVTLRKLPANFWPNWPFSYKQAISALLSLPTREAADRVRKLPAVLFRGVPQADLEPTLVRIRRAFNRPGEQLPLDAIAITPHVLRKKP
jgi:uncharacterized protein (TIGR02996 family)